MPTLTRPYRLIITLAGVDFISTARFGDDEVAYQQATDLHAAYQIPVGIEHYDVTTGWTET